MFLVISLSAGFAVAGTVLVAPNKGAGNTDRVDHVAGQTIALVILVTAVFSTAGFLATPFLLELIGAVPGTAAEYRLSVEYTRTIFVGGPSLR